MPIDVIRLNELLTLITQGEWKVGRTEHGALTIRRGTSPKDFDKVICYLPPLGNATKWSPAKINQDEQSKLNAEFIVLARNILPQLLKMRA